jgi:hypothetical protein
MYKIDAIDIKEDRLRSHLPGREMSPRQVLAPYLFNFDLLYFTGAAGWNPRQDG